MCRLVSPNPNVVESASADIWSAATDFSQSERDPISIVVPCYGLIGANCKLVGYGGGLPRKEWLLIHEFGKCRG